MSALPFSHGSRAGFATGVVTNEPRRPETTFALTILKPP
jgi:hypothetical protein